MAPTSQLASGRYPLIMAAGMAVLAATLAYFVIAGRSNRMEREWQPIKVVVAARPIQKGQVLTTEDVAADEVPKRFLLGSHVPSEEFENAHIIGQRTTVDFNVGDPILLNFIEATAERASGFSGLIMEKARAVSVRVSPESSVSSWIRPGDRVDVLATFRDPTGTESITTTLLENVIVLATGQLTGRDSFVPQSQRQYNALTLQVLPEAAEILVLGQTLGTLYFTLRNPADSELNDTRNIATTMKTIVSGERSRILNKQQKKEFHNFNIDIIKGNSIQRESFPKR